MIREYPVDLTDEIARGDVLHIIKTLQILHELGYKNLFWDGYDSTIEVYKCVSDLPEKCNISHVINSLRGTDITSEDFEKICQFAKTRIRRKDGK